jgi:hypothetical protein
LLEQQERRVEIAILEGSLRLLEACHVDAVMILRLESVAALVVDLVHLFGLARDDGDPLLDQRGRRLLLLTLVSPSRFRQREHGHGHGHGDDRRPHVVPPDYPIIPPEALPIIP